MRRNIKREDWKRTHVRYICGVKPGRNKPVPRWGVTAPVPGRPHSRRFQNRIVVSKPMIHSPIFCPSSKAG